MKWIMISLSVIVLTFMIGTASAQTMTPSPTVVPSGAPATGFGG